MTVLAVGLLGDAFVVSDALWVQVLLGGIVVGAYAYGLCGYSVQDRRVLVHRLGWARRFTLSELQEVELVPGVTVGAIRPFGNGGFFGFIRLFRNATLGSYRAYATKDKNAVVLHFTERPVVVTPDEPAAFVEAVELEREALG